MPSDIRSFFGGRSTVDQLEKPKQEEKPKKRGRARRVVEDDDEDDESTPKKTTPKRAATKKKPEPEPILEETTADDFFSKDTKPRRTEDVRSKNRAKSVTTPKKNAGKADDKTTTPNERTSTRSRANDKTTTPNGRASTRSRPSTRSADINDDDFLDDDLEDNADDLFKSEAKRGRRMDDDYEEGTDDEEDVRSKPVKKQTARQKKLGKDEGASDPDADVDMKDTNPEDDFVVPDEDEEIVADLPAKKTPIKGSRKRKSTALGDDDDDDELEIRQAKPSKKRATPSKAAKKKEEPLDGAEVQAIFDSIPTIEPPPPPSKSGGTEEGKRKFQFGQHANSAVPAGALSADEIPNGADNCLAGLTFVFTGQLQRLGREQGQNLVKQYGGKVTTAPSKKTSYVVLGEDAGPKKLETIKQNNLKVINEDGLFELIKRMPPNGGDGAAAEKHAEKLAKEEENIRIAAEEIERQERARLAASKPKPETGNDKTAQSGASKGKTSEAGPDTRLWTARYAPQSLSQICGNKTQVEKLQRWLRGFPKNQQKKFKLPGPDGSGIHRAVMIHGPPGIGKTTAAHLVAKLEGYDVVESNASDTRSKKLVETGLKGVLSTTSLMGYFAQGTSDVDASKKKLVLIMDEVDGMSAGDRGGVGALAAVCKKSQIPMILICNERKLPKMRPFDFVTFDLPFRRPTADMIRSRISTIAFREGLKLPAPVINALIEGTGSDIRQVVNMLSTAKLDSQTMTFEETKDMTKAWEKHIVLKPWDMVGKILGGGLFNAASKSTLNEKSELYFNDHEFAPLMMQENYLGTNPQRTNIHNDNPKLKRLASLDLISKAADSISDGDLVDRMIHGSQQQWSLMPAHAIFSFVRPASFVNGSMAGHQTRFTAWLGKNSNQGKLSRFVKEIQGHMRLRVSADRHEIRQTYLPMLFDRLVKRLEAEGKEVVPEIIELMDFYYLTKDDWDAILELGVGTADMESIKIETQAKATFTRLYNQQSHPLPFIKASQVMAPKRAPAKEKPDLEEALEESEEEVVDEAEVKEEDEEDLDLSKDKYVKQPKKKKSAPAKTSSSKKKKSKDDDDDEGVEEDGDVKPKKGKGKVRAKK